MASPGLPFLSIKEPLQLNHLVSDKVLAVLVLCFGSDAVLFAVPREESRHVVLSGFSEFQLHQKSLPHTVRAGGMYFT